MFQLLTFFKKKKKYEMDVTLANETLQNVFNACNKKPNSIPFDKILLRQRASTKLFSFGKWLSLVMLLITFFLPLAFFNGNDTLLRNYEMQINENRNSLTLLDYYVKENILYLKLDQSNIAVDQCYLQLIDQTIVPFLSFDVESNLLSFPYPDESANIFIYGEGESFLHLFITPKND